MSTVGAMIVEVRRLSAWPFATVESPGSMVVAVRQLPSWPFSAIEAPTSDDPAVWKAWAAHAPDPERSAKVAARLASPDRPTLDVVGREFGISRELVRLIARAEGVTFAALGPRPKPARVRTCKVCGARYTGFYPAHNAVAQHRRVAGYLPNEERDAAIAALLVARPNMLQREIASRFGIGAARVSQIARERGIARYTDNRAKVDENREARMVAAYERGDKIADIAAGWDLSPTQTQRVLRTARRQGRVR